MATPTSGVMKNLAAVSSTLRLWATPSREDSGQRVRLVRPILSISTGTTTQFLQHHHSFCTTSCRASDLLRLGRLVPYARRIHSSTPEPMHRILPSLMLMVVVVTAADAGQQPRSVSAADTRLPSSGLALPRCASTQLAGRVLRMQITNGTGSTAWSPRASSPAGT
jgi:hypothetical protein